MSKKKLKVKANKTYPLNQCLLYKVPSLKKLCVILKITKEELLTLMADSESNGLYNCYENKEGRLIQEPRDLMYVVHNRIANLLSRVKTPDYIHYSKKGHSHISNAEVHLDSNQLMTFDIKSYYPSISSELIRKFFRHKLKCEQDIAYLLSKLCTIDGSLPTGSQISVYLCNLVNLDMFNEMKLQCDRFNHKFTVYADDITISGESVNESHYNVMRKILERYGYEIKESKTKRYTSNQTPIVTGIALTKNLDAKNDFYKQLRQLCDDINFIIDNASYAQLKDEYYSLKGKAQYLKQLQQKVPEFVFTTQARLEKKLEGQI
ncbi:reverse transcriptase family protein [Psychrobacter sp. FDAARGOS_221]|uniref:reverse transcriptase family protein n=1 Tax=Psychrobacter sp. FDAARGOS_221 TaxID=1975705 RepID=UPI000BB55C96|nr:reverse transcriptase family protein [Psychrobacter sp. FDAARGOS_221]PNK60163.1 RNA-directed DNA polymerase [Psychrobacter sp. FDAARGOS_221]